MRGLWIFPLLAGACTFEPVDCEQLAAQLIACDVRPVALACDALGPQEQQQLAQRLDDDGCDGLWEHGRVSEAACDAFGWDCPPTLYADSNELPTRYPIVFVGGIDAREDYGWNPRVMEGVATATGSRVHHIALPSWSPTVERTEALWQSLADLPGNPARYNLICYAVGGLDCRFLVSPGGLFADDPEQQDKAAARIASITTIATPHRGTDVANAALSFATLQDTSSLLAAVLGPEGAPTAQSAETKLRETLRGLTNEHTLAFNATVVDDGDVSYRSWAGISHVGGQPLIPSRIEIEAHCVTAGGSLAYYRHPGTHDTMTELLWATAPFSMRTLASAGTAVNSPSDGMIAVDSARWGRFDGCIPTDHYDVIGQLGDAGADPNTGFDAVAFYSQLANNLATEGY